MSKSKAYRVEQISLGFLVKATVIVPPKKEGDPQKLALMPVSAHFIRQDAAELFLTMYRARNPGTNAYITEDVRQKRVYVA